jgi:hypothetical protein
MSAGKPVNDRREWHIAGSYRFVSLSVRMTRKG